MIHDIDATDLFCGAGGSSSGLTAAGVKVRIAANHWRLAVDSHNANHPNTDHDCADISQSDPRRYPRTTLLWASPSCTAHSGANANNRKQAETGLGFGELYPPLPKEAAERSRATMWDVVRFAEYHHYRGIVVENVVEVTKWLLFEPWLASMVQLGYDYKVLSINSMHAHSEAMSAAPQSRDRVYIAFWKKGDTPPKLDITPDAPCVPCGVDVKAVQRFKKAGTRWGKYRSQYLYHCPKCTAVVEPYVLPASTAIDWTLPSQRIGDRVKPLADKTMARIQAGVDKFGFSTLFVPVEGRDGKVASPAWQPLRTQTARNETGVLMPFMVSLRGGGSMALQERVDTHPLLTVSASGNHHGLVMPPGFLMRNNGSTGPGGEHNTPFYEPTRTMTTAGHQSVVLGDTTVEDCSFRMLEPHEVGAAMAFEQDYIVLGNKRERVRQYGNAVTPPAAALIAAAYVDVLSSASIAA